jgi:hypothetical protein
MFVRERGDDLAKGSADDDADSKIGHIAAHRELAELFRYWSLPSRG